MIANPDSLPGRIMILKELTRGTSIVFENCADDKFSAKL